MPNAATSADKIRRFRERLRAAGRKEVLFEMPSDTLALIDELKKRQKLPNRSEALLKLIEQGRAATQQIA